MNKPTVTTKPFRSRAQWRWAHATGQPWAKRWAEETPGGKGTRFRRLPQRVDKKAVTVITGNLGRNDESGEFAAVDSGGSGKNGNGNGETKRETRRREQREQRDRERREERDRILTDAGIDKNLQGALIDAREGNLLTDANGAKLAEMGLAVQGEDGTWRLTSDGRQVVNAANRGDAGRVRDTLGRGRDRVVQGRRREEERTQRAAEREQARQQRQQQQASRRQRRARERQQREAQREQERREQRLQRQGRIQFGRGRGRSGTGGSRGGRSARGGGSASQQRNRRAQAQQAAQQAVEQRLEEARRRQPPQAPSEPREKAFATPFVVFKDRHGHDRWLSVTTTAYLDADNEIISTKAIQQIVKHGDQTGQRGTLRFWHVPGMDIGVCDWQATAKDNRFLIESGTFNGPAQAAIGRKMAAKGYQMSPGFLHSRAQPVNGVFDTIILFERSPVPFGRASNRFTRFLTKEQRMLNEEKRKEWQDIASEHPDLLQELLASVEKTDKAAQGQNVVYKDDRIAALEATVKALQEQVRTKMPMMDEEKQDEDEMEAEEVAAVGDAMAEDAAMDDAGMDMMDDAALIRAIVQGVKAELSPMFDLEKKMSAFTNDIKGMVGGMYGQKEKQDTERQQEIDQLRQQLQTTEQRLKELEGDQPSANGYRASEEPDTVIDTNNHIVEQTKAANTTGMQPHYDAILGKNTQQVPS